MHTFGQRMFDRMHDAYHASVLQGVCAFEIDGQANEQFHVVVGADGIAYGDGAHSNPSSKVRMTSTIANFMLESPESIEFRSPTFARQMDVQGDLSLAFSLGLLLRRPCAATVARFDEASRISRARPPIRSIERLRRPSTEQVLACLAEQRPVVVEGALDAWPIPQTLEALAEQFGHCALSVDPRIVQQRNISDLVRALDGGDSEEIYTHGCQIPSAMQKAFPPPFFERHGPPAIAQLWMGQGGAGVKPVTLLHRDDLHGLLAQLYGFKRVLMFPPDQGEFLYPSIAYTNSQPCHVDPTDADQARYPLYANAHALQVRLGPGDILVNPLGWFHCVFAENKVVSLSYSFSA
jgi:hypothetical protein